MADRQHPVLEDHDAPASTGDPRHAARVGSPRVVLFAPILGVPDSYRRHAPVLPVSRETEAQAAAAAFPVAGAI